MLQPLWRIVWRFLNKQGIKLPYKTAIPLLGIHPEKITIQKDTYSPSVHCSIIYNSQDIKGNLDVHQKMRG